MADRITTSSDKPVPQGMTQAEHLDNVRKKMEAEHHSQSAQDVEQKAHDQQHDRQHVDSSQQQSPALTQEDAAQKIASEQQALRQKEAIEKLQGQHVTAKEVEPVDRQTVELNAKPVAERFYTGNVLYDSDKSRFIKSHLDAVILAARDLPNSDELAAFTASILTALRELKTVRGS